MHESSLFISKPVSLWLEMKEREDVWHLVGLLATQRKDRNGCQGPQHQPVGYLLELFVGGHWHPLWVLRPPH